MERIEANSPITARNKVNFSHINLFLVQIAILGRILEQAGHEAKSNFIQEISVEFLAHFEERAEGVALDNVHEEEFAHYVLLDLKWDRIEILFAR